jgi:hypothetical protein
VSETNAHEDPQRNGDSEKESPNLSCTLIRWSYTKIEIRITSRNKCLHVYTAMSILFPQIHLNINVK